MTITTCATRRGSLAVALFAAILLSLGGCASTPKPKAGTKKPAKLPDLTPQKKAAATAVAALRAGKFEDAEKAAVALVKATPDNVFGRLVRAITQYKKTMHQLSTDLRTVLFGALRAGGINHRYMRSALVQTEKELGLVAADLAASANPALSVELCLACWEVDWNHNGRIDRADRLLFQIERDAAGKRIPPDDPRRKPIFRFDYGDVAWAQAFVTFQRAALNVLLAYKWTEIDKLLKRRRRRRSMKIRLRMTQPALVATARKQVLEGLAFADKARKAYLAETDDDREWVPNPRQKSHPLPLPVDEALYTTWKNVIGDVERMVQGKEGLSVEALAQLGDHKWENPPKGFIDIGGLLSKPKDIVFNLKDLFTLRRTRNVEGMLKSILGDGYVPQMKPSPIIGRLSRMKSEIKRGKESFERKLRYLLWLN